MGVSEGHRQVTRSEYLELTRTMRDLWDEPAVAAQQRTLVDAELARMRAGQNLAVFSVLQALMAHLGTPINNVLEVGCASGYYYEVLRNAGWDVRYLGVDASPVLIDLARHCYPSGEFRVADATALRDIGQFDLVFSGACLMHIYNWWTALAEFARVSRGPVILHRTPIVLGGETSYWAKSAYGMPCLEQHFGEAEFLTTLRQSGLRVSRHLDVGDSGEYVMRSYLCHKEDV